MVLLLRLFLAHLLLLPCFKCMPLVYERYMFCLISPPPPPLPFIYFFIYFYKRAVANEKPNQAHGRPRRHPVSTRACSQMQSHTKVIFGEDEEYKQRAYHLPPPPPLPFLSIIMIHKWMTGNTCLLSIPLCKKPKCRGNHFSQIKSWLQMHFKRRATLRFWCRSRRKIQKTNTVWYTRGWGGGRYTKQAI